MKLTRRAACVLGAAVLASPALAKRGATRIEQWGLYDVALKGPATGNPFLDVSFSAVFDTGAKSIEVPGFYDGNGVYRMRFMPPEPGVWHWKIKANAAELDGKTGSFEAVAPSKTNHGPVAVADTYHFSYSDGTPYRPFGTTSYAWTHQSDALCEETLKTLAASPFNKLRFAIFPNEDVATNALFPFVGAASKWDFTQFNPAFFQRLDKFVARLGALGIEADIILFHPYDHGKFGFDSMPAEADTRYLRYVVARYAAYRHVWWSLANEYDDMKAKTDTDFDKLFQVVQKADPFDHLRSIHHNRTIYDNSKPWVTHASIQNGSAVIDDGRAMLYRDVWKKPVVFDEVKYEGNLVKRWGNLSGEELVKRCWFGTIAGTYVGHGESFSADGKKMFLGEGGRLQGQSPARIGFLRKIVEEGPHRIDPIDKWQDRHMGGRPGSYYLAYFGDKAPQEWSFLLPSQKLKGGEQFRVDIIDTWAMTVTPVEGTFTVHAASPYDFVSDRKVTLPGKPWQALRIQKI